MAAMAAAPPAEWPAIAIRDGSISAAPGQAGVRAGQLAEHEGDIRCPACHYLLAPAPSGVPHGPGRW